MRKNIKAVICAAGSGKRLMPLTKNFPKPLIKIGKKTILEYILENLSFLNIRDVIIVVGYKSDSVIKKIGKKYKKCQITYIYNKDFLTTNNIYSLWLAKNQIKDEMIFFNGDIIFNKNILKRVLEQPSKNGLVVDFNCKLDQDAMKAKFKKDRLIDIGKKLEGRSIGWAIGIYKLSKTGSKAYFNIAEKLFKIKENKNISFVVPLKKMAKKILINSISTERYKWVEIDTYEDYYKAKKLIDEIIC